MHARKAGQKWPAFEIFMLNPELFLAVGVSLDQVARSWI